MNRRRRTVRLLALLLACATVSGCGMGKAVRQTGETFDKYGCLAKDFKGEAPCEDADSSRDAGTGQQ